jgi:hypothetical protein
MTGTKRCETRVKKQFGANLSGQAQKASKSKTK